MKIIEKVSALTETPSSPRSVSETLAPLFQLARTSVSVISKPLPTFEFRDQEYHVPRFLFIGPKGGGDSIRVALLASPYGDEPEATFILIDFIQNLEKRSELATDYCLFAYPILNPTGFETKTRLTANGTNIPNELWKNSLSPEVRSIQSELWMHGFDGLVSFRTNTSSTELTIAVGGNIFFRHLLATALPAAQDLLPQIVKTDHEALPKWKTLLLDQPNELIRSAPGLKPRPFEIVITLPSQVPLYILQTAVTLLLQSVLAEYHRFIAFGANL